MDGEKGLKFPLNTASYRRLKMKQKTELYKQIRTLYAKKVWISKHSVKLTSQKIEKFNPKKRRF